MVQPDRRERQPAAEPGPPPSSASRYKALVWARDRFEGSLAQRFLTRLTALDFADQAMLFGAGLLVSLLPFVILLSAFASQRVDDDISLRLGLDRKAAGIMDHLFTAAPATLNATTATSLVFLVFGMVAAFSVAGAAVNKWSRMPAARRSRPRRREMSSSMRWLANALSKMTSGSRETSKPAPNNMA